MNLSNTSTPLMSQPTTFYPSFNATSIIANATITSLTDPTSANMDNYTMTNMSSNSTNSTFGGQPPLEIVPIAIVKAASVALLIIVAIFGNLLVCISFALFRNLRSLTNYFILSLSMADLLSACFVMPIWFGIQLYNHRWPSYQEQPTILKFWMCLDMFLCIAGVLSLCAISVERCLAITNPFCYTKWLSTHRVLFVIACIWVTGLIISTIAILPVIKNRNALTAFILIPSYVLPFTIMVIMYTKIFIVAKRQARRLRQDGAFATDLKAMKMIAIVVGAYLVCYTPNFGMVVYVHSGTKPPVTIGVVSAVRWLTYLNSCLNPIIYSCFNKTYRKAFKRLLKTCGKTIQDFHRDNTSSSKMTASKNMQSRMSLNITMRSSAGSLLDGPKVPGVDTILLDGNSRSSVYCNRISQASMNAVIKPADNKKNLVEEPAKEVAETVQ